MIDIAADGKSAVMGAKLAVSQINAKGGVNGRKLELVIYDDQASPKNAVPIANKLIGGDKVRLAISGSYSGATRAAAGVFQGAKIPSASVEAELRLPDEAARAAFMSELVESLKSLLAKHGRKDGQRFRVALAAYPELEEEK